MKRLVYSILLLIASTTLLAYDAEIDGIYYNFSGNEAEVTFQKRGEDQIPMSDYAGNITVPEQVVFNGNSYIVTSIGSSAFQGCTGITSITFSEGLKSIGRFSFEGCKSITSINIPEGVERIEEGAFEGCINLVSVSLPMSLTKIDGYAFCGCSNLSLIDIPNCATKIGNEAFAACKSLTSITIPEGSRCVDKGTFYGCTNLKSIILPESLIYIEWFGFSGCSNLSTIVCNAKRPPSVGEFSFYKVNKPDCKLYVPKGCEEAYRTSDEWKDFNIIEMETSIASPLGKTEEGTTIYDLGGRKMVNGKLPKGLYIMNGKKVAVK